MKKKLVVFTGAGISAESGIPTFRDANGMWGKYDAMKLASVEGFEEDPQAVLDFYNARRKTSWKCNLIMLILFWLNSKSNMI